MARLPTYPSVVVYSERSLSMRAPGVRETRCRDPEAAYRYRYEGLTLALQSGDQYLFLPRRWTAADGVALLIPRSDALRLEFLRPAPGPARPSEAQASMIGACLREDGARMRPPAVRALRQ